MTAKTASRRVPLGEKRGPTKTAVKTTVSAALKKGVGQGVVVKPGGNKYGDKGGKLPVKMSQKVGKIGVAKVSNLRKSGAKMPMSKASTAKLSTEGKFISPPKNGKVKTLAVRTVGKAIYTGQKNSKAKIAVKKTSTPLKKKSSPLLQDGPIRFTQLMGLLSGKKVVSQPRKARVAVNKLSEEVPLGRVQKTASKAPPLAISDNSPLTSKAMKQYSAPSKTADVPRPNPNTQHAQGEKLDSNRIVGGKGFSRYVVNLHKGKTAAMQETFGADKGKNSIVTQSTDKEDKFGSTQDERTNSNRFDTHNSINNISAIRGKTISSGGRIAGFVKTITNEVSKKSTKIGKKGKMPENRLPKKDLHSNTGQKNDFLTESNKKRQESQANLKVAPAKLAGRGFVTSLGTELSGGGKGRKYRPDEYTGHSEEKKISEAGEGIVKTRAKQGGLQGGVDLKDGRYEKKGQKKGDEKEGEEVEGHIEISVTEGKHYEAKFSTVKLKDNVDAIFSQSEFEKLPNINKRLAGTLKHHGFVEMTNIQKKGIPLMLDDSSGNQAKLRMKDIFVRAATGSGKTLLYLIPTLNHILNTSATQATPYKRSDGALVLIVCPTRELCVQTYEVSLKLGQLFPWIVVSCLSGGEKKKAEKSRIRKGVTILICTPGRLIDHIDTTCVLSNSFRNLAYLILDEADRLLDMGFESKIRKIYEHVCAKALPVVSNSVSAAQPANSVSPYPDEEPTTLSPSKGKTPKEFSTILVSATLNEKVQNLANLCIDPANSEWLLFNENGDLMDVAKKPDIHSYTPKSKNNTEKSITQKGDISQNAPSSLPTKNNHNHDNVFEQISKFQISMPSTLEQYYLEIPTKNRLIYLMSLLLNKVVQQQEKVIVFVCNCYEVEFIHTVLPLLAWPSETYIGKRKLHKGPSGQRVEGERGEEEEEEEGENATNDKSQKKWISQEVMDSNKKKLFSQNNIFAPILEQIQFFKLHGSMERHDRLGYLADFAAAGPAVLITTDVAARGLNLPQVKCVVQYDPPQHIDEYIHRAGRTARLGHKGTAILMLQSPQLDFVEHLEKNSISLHPLDSDQYLLPIISTFLPPHLSSLRSVAQFLTAFFCTQISADEDLLQKARRAYTATIRAYQHCESSFRAYLTSKRLHLGHLAASFCLRESPHEVSNFLRETAQPQTRRRKHKHISRSASVYKNRGPAQRGLGPRKAPSPLAASKRPLLSKTPPMTPPATERTPVGTFFERPRNIFKLAIDKPQRIGINGGNELLQVTKPHTAEKDAISQKSHQTTHLQKIASREGARNSSQKGPSKGVMQTFAAISGLHKNSRPGKYKPQDDVFKKPPPKKRLTSFQTPQQISNAAFEFAC